MTCRAFVVAGTATGVGKTSVALGLLRAFAAGGRVVRSFKVGPDFIDPALHRAASGEWGRNLDGWLLDPATNRRLFRRRCAGADVAVVEGVMGLYDGIGPGERIGSTAEMASLLGLPVVLVIDAWTASRSVGAVAEGFVAFESDVDVAGVVLNRVASEAHRETAVRAVRDGAGVPVLGAIPRDERATIPERHLGLHRPSELDVEPQLEALGRLVAAHVDLDRLSEEVAEPVAEPPDTADPARRVDADVRIGVPVDRAFSFYYRHNFDLLRQNGAELVQFSTFTDDLPDDLDGLYIGGGYPEVYAEPLADNTSLRRDIRALARSGRPILAECGGLMYLADALESGSGERYPMCGVLGGITTEQAQSTIGYAEVAPTGAAPFFDDVDRARGHLFHTSDWVDGSAPEGTSPAYRLWRPGSGERSREGVVREAVLASYVHLHFGSRPGYARSFVEACRRR
ncbi:MAG: cobyrinate a,c-diamide synthase [Bradymonadaceae bacterium]